MIRLAGLLVAGLLITGCASVGIDSNGELVEAGCDIAWQSNASVDETIAKCRADMERDVYFAKPRYLALHYYLQGDYQQALRWFSKADTPNRSNEYNQAVKEYRQQALLVVSQDRGTGLHMLKSLADEHRDAKSAFHLAQHYFYGVDGRSPTIESMYKYAYRAIEYQYPGALLFLEVVSDSLRASAVTLHQNKQYEKAFQEFQRLAHAGDAIAQSYVAEYYLLGLHGVKDRVKSAQWFRQSAELNNLNGQKMAGEVYFDLAYNPEDSTTEKQRNDWYKMSFQFAQAAANHGDYHSAFRLGFLFQHGLGVKADSYEARKWYEVSVNNSSNSYRPAMLNLAVMYRLGAGGKQNLEQAKHLLNLVMPEYQVNVHAELMQINRIESIRSQARKTIQWLGMDVIGTTRSMVRQAIRDKNVFIEREDNGYFVDLYRQTDAIMQGSSGLHVYYTHGQNRNRGGDVADYLAKLSYVFDASADAQLSMKLHQQLVLEFGAPSHVGGMPGEGTIEYYWDLGSVAVSISRSGQDGKVYLDYVVTEFYKAMEQEVRNVQRVEAGVKKNRSL